MIVRRIGYAAAALALATVAACGTSHPKASPAAQATSSTVPSQSASAPVSPSVSTVPVSGAPSPSPTRSIKLGTLDGRQVLVDDQGKALYLFANDKMNTTTCLDACAVVWPPLLGPVGAGSGLKAADLSTLTRPDDTKQVTYFGTPLYYYQGDTGPGTANGQGLNLNGGLWYLVDNKGKAAK